jgi:hypothetical protein
LNGRSRWRAGALGATERLAPWFDVRRRVSHNLVVRFVLVALVTAFLVLLTGQGFGRARAASAGADHARQSSGSLELARRSPERLAPHQVTVETNEPRVGQYPIAAADERPRRAVACEAARPDRPACEREPRQWKTAIEPPPPRA